MRSGYLKRDVFKRYLSARQDFLDDKYKLATKKLMPISLITDNSDVNHLLVNSLYRQHDYSGAERVLFEDINSYTSSDKLVRLMIDVLLRNDEFIICYEIIASFQSLNTRHNLLRHVKRREADYLAENSKRVSKNAREFYHLSSVSIIRQRIRLRAAQRLPLSTFVRISRNLFVDPFLVPIMRLSILDVFRKVGLRLKIRYRWIDRKVYVLNTKNLTDLTETKSYRGIMKAVNDKYFHDPSRMVALKKNLRLDLSYLYPFNDGEVRDYSLWVKIAELRLQGKQPLFLNRRVKSVYMLQVKLNQLTKDLVK